MFKMEILLRIKTIMKEINFIQKVIRYIDDNIFLWKHDLQGIDGIYDMIFFEERN